MSISGSLYKAINSIALLNRMYKLIILFYKKQINYIILLFFTSVGVRHGDTLSSTLFNIYELLFLTDKAFQWSKDCRIIFSLKKCNIYIIDSDR